MKQYDLVVIGSGPAGEKAAVKAAYFGKRVALVEKKRQLGGSCVQAGLPSKALKQSALYLSGRLEEQLYGAKKEAARPPAIRDLVHRQLLVTEAMSREVRRNLTRHGVDLYRGTAVLDDPRHVHIMGEKEEVLETEYVLLASGSAPTHPSWIPFDDPRVFDTDTMSTLEEIPERLCIVGAGVIGCEYATIFAAMGVAVDLVDASDTILPHLDSDVRSGLFRLMEKSGIRLLWRAKVEGIDLPSDPKAPLAVRLSSAENLESDLFLYAAGRRGVVEGMGLEELSVQMDERRSIIVDEGYRTSVPNIFAAGDVIGFPSLASTSMDQGRVAVSHMFDIRDLEEFRTVLPYVLYTMPEAAMVGITEEEAKGRRIDYGVGIARFGEVARGQIMGLSEGFLKLIFTRGDRVVRGVHCLGPLASEFIHYGVTLVEAQRTLNDLSQAVFNFPTLHELYQAAAYDALSNLAGRPVRVASRITVKNPIGAK